MSQDTDDTFRSVLAVPNSMRSPTELLTMGNILTFVRKHQDSLTVFEEPCLPSWRWINSHTCSISSLEVSSSYSVRSERYWLDRSFLLGKLFVRIHAFTICWLDSSPIFCCHGSWLMGLLYHCTMKTKSSVVNGWTCPLRVRYAPFIFHVGLRLISTREHHEMQVFSNAGVQWNSLVRQLSWRCWFRPWSLCFIWSSVGSSIEYVWVSVGHLISSMPMFTFLYVTDWSRWWRSVSSLQIALQLLEPSGSTTASHALSSVDHHHHLECSVQYSNYLCDHYCGCEERCRPTSHWIASLSYRSSAVLLQLHWLVLHIHLHVQWSTEKSSTIADDNIFSATEKDSSNANRCADHWHVVVGRNMWASGRSHCHAIAWNLAHDCLNVTSLWRDPE